MNHTTTLIIGIDPGTHTGIAVKDLSTGQFTQIETLKLHEAMQLVKEMNPATSSIAHLLTHGPQVFIIVEDARQRTWIPKETGREVLQGVGSVKRDCSIWEDYIADLGLPYRMVKPAAHKTKWNLESWQAATGWTARTSNHARDAAILIHGINARNVQTIKWNSPTPISGK